MRDAIRAPAIQNYLSQSHEGLGRSQRGARRIGPAETDPTIAVTVGSRGRSPAPTHGLIPHPLTQEATRDPAESRLEGHDHVGLLRAPGPAGRSQHHGPGHGVDTEGRNAADPGRPVPSGHITVVSRGRAAGVRSRVGIEGLHYLQVVFSLLRK